MINRWFYGTLGKLAGVLYTLGIISLVLSVSLGSTLGVQASPATQGQGNCLAAGAGQERDKYDDGGDHTFNAPSGWIYVEAGLKAGDACFSRTTDGTITVEGEACYSVSGLGTNSVTIEQLKSTSVCKDISHTEAIREQAPTDPPEPTEETPSPEPTTETPEPEPTTETPEPEPTTETPEPEPTTETPEPESPNLVDPKVDSLIQDNDGNGVPSPGDVLQYTMTITNTGGSAATGVVFNDSPDNNTSLVVGSVTSSKGSVVVGNTAGDNSVQVDIGTIEPDEVITITFNVTIVIGISTDVTSVSNQGIITGDNFPDKPTDDPDTNDPDDPTDTSIVHPTPQPTNTPSDPDDPTPEPQPTSVSTTTVLIPVTGVDRSAANMGGGLVNSQVFMNLSLGLFGLGMILQGLAYKKRKDQ